MGHFFLSHMPWHLFICCSSAFQAMRPGSEADFLEHIVVWKAALYRFLASILNARWVGNLQIELTLKDFNTSVGGKTYSSGKWAHSYLQELVNIHGKGNWAAAPSGWSVSVFTWITVCSAVPVSKVNWSVSQSTFLTEPNRQGGSTQIPCLQMMEMRIQGSTSQNFPVHTSAWEFPGVLYLT